MLKFEYSKVSPWKLLKILIVGLLEWDPEIWELGFLIILIGPVRRKHKGREVQSKFAKFKNSPCKVGVKISENISEAPKSELGR